MQRTKTHKMVLCALFAALTAMLSQIAIPIGPVPINLATFAVFCAGALLGSKLGALSLAVFAALGAVGVPVFAMFRGGLGALVGPTGGYIIGYIPAAFVTGLIIEKFNRGNKIYLYPVAMLGGMLTCFTLGTAWFMFSMNTGLWNSLRLCVIPFLPGDFLKIAAATMIAKGFRAALHMSSENAASSEDKASKKKWPVIASASLSLVIVMFFVFVGNPVMAWNRYVFGRAVKNTAATSVMLNEITPFEWDALYSFAPHLPKQEIESVIGFTDNNIRETVNEGMVHLLFVKDGKLVCIIRGYSDNLGYAVLFETGGSYSKISYEDNTIFEVKHDGNVVELSEHTG